MASCSANHSRGGSGSGCPGGGGGGGGGPGAGSTGVNLGAIVVGQPGWLQRKIHLRPQHRGVHLVTEEILRQLPELSHFTVGLMHIQLLHTSASLAINENWDPDVRDDMEMMLNRIVPEEGIPFRHSCEGPDDMPAHVKACFLGSNLTVPVSDGKLNLGTWQGVWLCEHRDRAGSRKVLVTVNGALRNGLTTGNGSGGDHYHHQQQQQHGHHHRREHGGESGDHHHHHHHHHHGAGSSGGSVGGGGGGQGGGGGGGSRRDANNANVNVVNRRTTPVSPSSPGEIGSTTSS